jgi:hypothetical protein
MKRALLFSSLLCVLVSVSLLAQASVSLSPSSYNFGSLPLAQAPRGLPSHRPTAAALP